MVRCLGKKVGPRTLRHSFQPVRLHAAELGLLLNDRGIFLLPHVAQGSGVAGGHSGCFAGREARRWLPRCSHAAPCEYSRPRHGATREESERAQGGFCRLVTEVASVRAASSRPSAGRTPQPAAWSPEAASPAVRLIPRRREIGDCVLLPPSVMRCSGTASHAIYGPRSSSIDSRGSRELRHHRGGTASTLSTPAHRISLAAAAAVVWFHRLDRLLTGKGPPGIPAFQVSLCTYGLIWPSTRVSY